MRWIPDNTKRFTLRPLFEESEIEQRASEFLGQYRKKRKIADAYPVTTSELKALADLSTDEANFFAKLDAGLDGYTTFTREGDAKMFINEDLNEKTMVRRQRFTIAHELGHVILHKSLFTAESKHARYSFESTTAVNCQRSRIDRPSVDWIEWQAYYFASCLLMPTRQVQSLVDRLKPTAYPAIRKNTNEATVLISDMAAHFCVSTQAAEVRAKQLGAVSDADMIGCMS